MLLFGKRRRAGLTCITAAPPVSASLGALPRYLEEVKHRFLTLALGLAMLCAGPAPASAEPGDLDPSFSSDGLVAALGGDGFVPRAVAVQGDGKIVVAGYSCAPTEAADGTCRRSGASSFRMTRYTADGGLDTEFGSSGVVTTAVGTTRSQAFDVLLQPDGRIVLAGVARDGGGRDGFALVRYDAAGAVDRSFGERGTMITPVGSGFAGIADVTEAGGGALLAAGVANDAQGATRFALARYRPDGTLDGGFGPGGGGTTLGAPAAYGSALAVTLSPSGQPLAAGISGASAEPAAARFGFLRTRADGTPDRGFGQDGGLLVPAGSGTSFANAVTTLQDGRAVAAGSAMEDASRQVMAFVQVTPDGRLDSTFDGDGSSLVRVGDGALASDVVRDREGRLVAIGQSASGGQDWRFALARLTADGILDRGFGTGGVTVTSFPGTTAARATAGAVTPDGRLVAAGIACVGGSGAQCTNGSPRLALARYLGGTVAAPPPPPAGGVLGVQSAPFAALAFPAGKLGPAFTIRIRVECLQRADCNGRLEVRTRDPYRLAPRGGRSRGTRRVTIARAPIRVPAGSSRVVRLRIQRTGRALVRRLGRVPVRVTVQERAPRGVRRDVVRDATLTGR